MDNLRLILLIIGCLIVAGIYLWDIFSNDKPKKRTDILNAVDETPESSIPPVQTNDVALNNFSADEEALADLGSLLARSRNENIHIEDEQEPIHLSETIENDSSDGDDEAPLPLEMSVKDYEASMEENNEPDIFSSTEDNFHEQDVLAKENELSHEIDDESVVAEVPESNKTSDDLLVLYITCPSHISFNGLSISKAADEVGMIYGHMNIFHHFGPGKLHSGQPLFSLANMHEPGSFDLGRMADLKTKGLAMFMYSPASIDASVVFELFLNTTQRLAELVGGTVRTVDNEVLSNVSINSLREKAESLSVNY